MSLLQQDSTELDDAARGEELTRGSGHLVITTIIAAVVVTIVVAIYVLAGQKPPDATGEIEQVWAHAQHSESSRVRRQRLAHGQGRDGPGVRLCSGQAA